MVSYVQSWPLLVAISIRYPVKFTVCLAPRLTSLLHRVKNKSFSRESLPSVASSTRSFPPRHWVNVTLLRSLVNSVSQQDTCLVGLGACIWHLSSCVSSGKMVVPTSQLKATNVLLLFGCMFCLVAFSRAVLPHSGTPFVITLSDGEGTGSVAAAIWSPLAPGGVHQLRWFQLDLPPSALYAWSEGKELEPQRHINKIEAIVPAICLCTWSHLIRGSLWVHFIDNDGALACLVSGYSKSSSLSAIVDYTWAQIPVLGCWPWFERVPSKCNIVDGLPRKNFSTALANDWVRDSTQLPEHLLDMTHARC